MERRGRKKKKNETDGAKWRKKERGRDGPPTLEHRERGVCFARCFYSGEARCRRTVCLEVGQVSMTVPQSLRSLSTCMRVPSQPMHMHCCYPSVQRAAALYYLSTMRAEPFFPAPASSIHFLSHFASDPRALTSVLPSFFLRISPPLLSLPPPTLRDFRPNPLDESSGKRERERVSLRSENEPFSQRTACSSFSFFLHFDQVTRELIRTSPPVRRKKGERGIGERQ